MSKTWKWILGIAVLLVVLFVAGFVLFNAWGFGVRTAEIPFYSRGAPMMRDFDNFRHPMVGPGFDDFRRPVMTGRAFVPFGGFFLLGGLLRLLFPLGILALVAFVSYRMGKKAGMASAIPAPSAAAAPEVEPPQEN
ncbi:MAG: hypothetical protein AB1846_08615 [Chloroflexota bacterium]